jgi:hypothetical protein
MPTPTKPAKPKVTRIEPNPIERMIREHTNLIMWKSGRKYVALIPRASSITADYVDADKGWCRAYGEGKTLEEALYALSKAKVFSDETEGYRVDISDEDNNDWD